jgi:hypothetical protein
MEQIKKNPNDPDVDQINPDIVQFARWHAFLKMPMELYLSGKLTWIECLELAIMLIVKEYRAQNRCLIETLKEKPDVYMALKELVEPPKRLPKLKLNDRESSVSPVSGASDIQ